MKKRIFLASTLTLFLASLTSLRAAEAVVTNPASTELGVVTGGEPGEAPLARDGTQLNQLPQGSVVGPPP